jgi:hypothetical protein
MDFSEAGSMFQRFSTFGPQNAFSHSHSLIRGLHGKDLNGGGKQLTVFHAQTRLCLSVVKIAKNQPKKRPQKCTENQPKKSGSKSPKNQRAKSFKITARCDYDQCRPLSETNGLPQVARTNRYWITSASIFGDRGTEVSR